MPFRIDNLIVLFGLFALAIPVLLHLLQRRRHDILDWGAMQFLPDSISTQRRRWLDEILLMLVRMAIIAILVLALATPISTSSWLGFLGDHSTRDIVLVLDGSYSMDVRVKDQARPWDEALRRARELIDEAPSSARVSILIARQPPVFVHEDFSHGFDDAIDVSPRGNADIPVALSQAWNHLQTHSTAAAKEIVVLTDGQRHGWADRGTLSALDNLGQKWHADAESARHNGVAIPSLRVVKVGADLPVKLPNYALAPLRPSRGIVRIGQKVSFQSALLLDDFATYQRPRAIKVVIDGKEKERLSLPEKLELKQGQVPLAFEQRFDKEGQHVVSLVVEADDALAADNEQHVVVEVVKELPILILDGDARLAPESSSFFLKQALSAKQVMPQSALQAADLAKPALIVLADVPQLSAGQIKAIDDFLAGGGGLLIAAGPRVALAKDFYNEKLYQKGLGWLPAMLGEVGTSKDGVQPEARKFQHPALELFRATPDSMKDLRFPKWLQAEIGPKDRATVIASFSNGAPFLIEKKHKNGRVILCTVPFDRRWASNFTGAWEFPVLAHELAYYLAGSKNEASLLTAGKSIRIASPLPSRVTLFTPEVAGQDIEIKNSPWAYDNTGAIGLYRVEAAGQSWNFVAPPDLAERDRTRATDDDWTRVRDRLRVAWQDGEGQSVATQDRHREELWWLLLVAVVGLLCVEVWMTRRMVMARL